MRYVEEMTFGSCILMPGGERLIRILGGRPLKVR